MMNFESLSNDTIFDIFDYFDGTELFYTFYGLNSRFNWLLYKEYRPFRFNFRSISKRKFDAICQQHLPLIADQVITLSLFDDDDTPQQIYQFYSYFSSITQFVNLRALSISNINTHERLLMIIRQCHHLSHLTYFRLNYGYLWGTPMLYQSIVNSIWSLPKLIHYDFNCTKSLMVVDHSPRMISSSIKRLSLSESYAKLNRIYHLCQCTPQLKYLSISLSQSDEFFLSPIWKIFKHPDDDCISSILPTLISFHLRFSNKANISKIISLLQNMPNLRILNIDLSSNLIDGYQWEQLISNYLPLLKIFRFKMYDNLNSNENIEEQMNQRINSFRSSFWINEHQWFVRCFSYNTTVYLYTSSQILPNCLQKFPDLFISTDSNDTLQRFANDITEITNKTFFNHLISSNIYLTNMKDLHINFPIDDQFWSIVQNLNRLKLLTIHINATISQSHLQSLLDRIDHLDKLTIHEKESKYCNMKLFNSTIKSLSYLNLYSFPTFSNEEECLALSQSSLGAQCELLTIKIKNYQDILSLVNNMINLRALDVHCQYDAYSNDSSSLQSSGTGSKNRALELDEVIEWLKERLPSTCLISMKVSEIDKYFNIGIWI